MLYRAKPTAVEAWLWGGKEAEEVPPWVLEATQKYPQPGGIAPFFEGDHALRDTNTFHDAPHLAVVMTNGSVIRMARGAWIIRGVDGTLSIAPPAVFAEMYEPATIPPVFADDFAQSFDAMDWAVAFVQRTSHLPINEMPSIALMHTWFANAMMRGWDERARRFPYRPSWRERFETWLFEKRRRKAHAATVARNQ